MKTQSQLECKKELNGKVRHHPYQQQRQQQQQQQQQQQRRIRVLEPTKQQPREKPASGSGARRSGGSVMHQQFGGQRYHAKLEGARELVLEANEFGLTWGVTHELPDDDGEFKLRLLQRASLSDQQQHQQQLKGQQPAQPQEQKEPDQVKRLEWKCVEVSRESLDLLCFHEPKIRSLMLAHDKAIIFQNIDVQVYVMEELKSEGFRVHFQDKRKTKVSLTYQQFLSLIAALSKVDKDYLKYKRKLKLKKYKMRAKELMALARCG